MIKVIEFRGERLTVSMVRKYDMTDMRAIELFDQEGMPYMRATVNVGVALPPGHTTIKDSDENRGILKALVDAGIVNDTEVQIGYGNFGQKAHIVEIL